MNTHKKRFDIAQKSTASVGRFDKTLKNEKKINTLKHKKVNSEVFKNRTAEKERNSKILAKLIKNSN